MQQKQLMDGGTGTQHPSKQTRDREWQLRALAEVEAEAKKEVGANCDELKGREDK